MIDIVLHDFSDFPWPNLNAITFQMHGTLQKVAADNLNFKSLRDFHFWQVYYW